MSTISKWIGSNGDILIPLTKPADNSGNLISTRGVFYLPIIEVAAGAPLQGNPMGLLLTLTYAADQ